MPFILPKKKYPILPNKPDKKDKIPSQPTQPTVPEQKVLPYKAIGFTEKGEAYYGEGMTGWLRKMSAMALDPSKILGSSYAEILEKRNVKLPAIAIKPGEVLTEEQISQKEKTEKEQMGSIDTSEWAAMIRNDPGAILRTGGMLIKTGFWGILDIMNQPQVGVRKLIASGIGAKEWKEHYRDILKVNPTANRAWVEKQYMRGSEMVYTSWLNGNKSDEFLRQVLDGETPAFIVEKLSNPWTELVGSVVFDPMWLVPFSKAKNVTAVKDVLSITDDGIRTAMKVAGEVQDVTRAGEALDGVVNAVVKAIELNEVSSTKIWDTGKNVFKILFSPTASSRAYISEARIAEVIGFVSAQVGNNVDEVAEVVSSIVRLRSKVPGEAAAAAASLLKKPYSNVLFSNAGLETQMVLSKIVDNDMPKFLTTIQKIVQDGDVPKLTKFLVDKVQVALRDVYPRMDDMEKAFNTAKKAMDAGVEINERTARLAKQYEQLNPVIKSITKADSFLQNKLVFGAFGYKDLNHFFSAIYMGMSPGYAVRNLLNGTVHLLADSGPTTAVKGLTFGFGEMISEALGHGRKSTLYERHVADIIEWFGGDISKTRALAGQGTADVMVSKTSNVIEAGLRGAQGGERGMSVSIWGDEFVREMKRAFKQGAIPNTSTLTDAGMPKEVADSIVRLVIDNKGNVKKAVNSFRKTAKTTHKLDAWKHIALDPYLENFLDSPVLKLKDKYYEIVNSSKTADELAVNLEEYILDLVKMVKRGAAADLGATSVDPATVKVVQELEQAVVNGFVSPEDHEKFIRMINAMEQSRIRNNESALSIYSALIGNRDIAPLIPAEVRNAALEAYYGITERMGTKAHDDFGRVTTKIRAICNTITDASDFPAIVNTLKKTAKETIVGDKTLIEPVFNLSNRRKFIESIWDWQRKAGHQFYYDMSVVYKKQLWDNVIYPLATAANIDLVSKRGLAQFLIDNKIETVATKLSNADDLMKRALKLKDSVDVRDWTGVDRIQPTKSEKFIHGITMSDKETINTINAHSKKVLIGFEENSAEAAAFVAKRIADGSLTDEEARALTYIAAAEKEIPSQLVGRAANVDTGLREIILDHVMRKEASVAETSAARLAAAGKRNAAKRLAVKRSFENLGIKNYVTEGDVPRLSRLSRRIRTDLKEEVTTDEISRMWGVKKSTRIVKEIPLEDEAGKIIGSTPSNETILTGGNKRKRVLADAPTGAKTKIYTPRSLVGDAYKPQITISQHRNFDGFVTNKWNARIEGVANPYTSDKLEQFVIRPKTIFNSETEALAWAEKIYEGLPIGAETAFIPSGELKLSVWKTVPKAHSVAGDFIRKWIPGSLQEGATKIFKATRERTIQEAEKLAGRRIMVSENVIDSELGNILGPILNAATENLDEGIPIVIGHGVGESLKMTGGVDVMKVVKDAGGHAYVYIIDNAIKPGNVYEAILMEAGEAGLKKVADTALRNAEEVAKEMAEEVVPKVAEPIEDTVEAVLRDTNIPAKPEEAFHTIPQALDEQLENLIPVLRMENQKRVRAFGKQIDVFTDPKIEAALGKWEAEAATKISEARAHATKFADAKRDFALLNYGGKRYLDKAVAYLFPYQFWYGRTYMNWMKRITSNPEIILAYSRYRKTLETLHAGMPDWWKYNLSTNDLPGMDSENPLYFNLEATLNPLQGLVGVDFNDPSKRVNWWSKAVDDVGKFGPTLFTPINWLVAGGLALQGEEDAASRWMGRLVPQTAMLKSVAYKLGIKSPLRYNELDPFVQVFSGGLDTFERRRVGRALGKMIDDGDVTAEAAQEAAHSQKGDIWDKAVALSQGDRAKGNLASFFAGVGFKMRSESDKQVDEFYTKYFNLWGMKDNLSPDKFTEAMRQLREQYPWMDAVLISRKPTEERDSSLAYSIMSRVPPGQKSDMAKLVDIDDLMDKFYSAKGNMSGWTDSDKTRFMAGIMDMGAVLAIPDDAQQQEYYQASDGYNAMNKALEEQFGEGILDKIDIYYQTESKRRDMYLQLHPEVEQALTTKNQMILTSPILNKYYGGISVLEQYYNNQMYDKLIKQYGADIFDKWDEYDTLQMQDAKAAKAYKKAHPELDAYTKSRKNYKNSILRIIADLGSKLPEEPQIPLRKDTLPGSNRQQEISDYVQPEQQMTWGDWQKVLSEPMQELILDYWTSGEKLPSAVTYKLDSLARDLDMYDGEEVLQMILIALRKEQ